MGLVLIVAIGAYFFTTPKEPVNTVVIPEASLAKALTPDELIANLKTNWAVVQTSIGFRPTYHNQVENSKKVWRTPVTIDSIGKNSLVVRFEDDNNSHVGIFNFDGSAFKLLKVYKNQGEFTESEWQEIMNAYGTPSYVSLVTEVMPTGTPFKQGEGAMIPLSWKVANPEAGSSIYISLASADGTELIGRISNTSDCSKGGDAIVLPTSKNTYKWDGLYVCSNWQAHSVAPGSYRIAVQLYSKDGTKVLASGQSKNPFTLTK